ncbi:MAG TPA: helix-turn-helix domain-containing protein, partial [Solirubrobacteraceae bacterium]
MSDGSHDRALGAGPQVRLADADPELFAGLTARERDEARVRAVAPTLTVERGRWDVADVPVGDPEACLGLLVLDGMVLRSVTVSSSPRSEIVGPGDVIRPWALDEVTSVPFDSRWQAVLPTRLAVLDERFLAVACRWPKLTLAIVGRLVRRARWLTLQLAISDLRRVDDRLLLFFWHVADRWGRVGPDGVAVALPVTHEMLAQLVCAQRPTVTTALKRLAAEGQLQRNRDRTWLLVRKPPAPAR